jgi:hypothetical protein
MDISSFEGIFLPNEHLRQHGLDGGYGLSDDEETLLSTGLVPLPSLDPSGNAFAMPATDVDFEAFIYQHFSPPRHATSTSSPLRRPSPSRADPPFIVAQSQDTCRRACLDAQADDIAEVLLAGTHELHVCDLRFTEAWGRWRQTNEWCAWRVVHIACATRDSFWYVSSMNSMLVRDGMASVSVPTLTPKDAIDSFVNSCSAIVRCRRRWDGVCAGTQAAPDTYVRLWNMLTDDLGPDERITVRRGTCLEISLEIAVRFLMRDLERRRDAIRRRQLRKRRRIEDEEKATPPAEPEATPDAPTTTTENESESSPQPTSTHNDDDNNKRAGPRRSTRERRQCARPEVMAPNRMWSARK